VFGGSLLAIATACVAETLRPGERARGQARAARAFAIATALPLVLGAALAGRGDLGEIWRWLWLGAAAPLCAWPWLGRALRETGVRSAPAVREATRAAGRASLLGPEHRGRAAALLVCAALVQGIEGATRAWLVYHPVRALGLSLGETAALLVTGAGLGLVGFRIGQRSADRRGRRATFVLASIVFAGSACTYYGVSVAVEAGRPVLLVLTVFGLSAAGNAALVALRALASELFPTPVRGAALGGMAGAGAAGACAALAASGALAPVAGGIGPAVCVLVLFALPVAAAIVARLPETAGLELGDGALEVPSPG
jgi:MFS family permease